MKICIEPKRRSVSWLHTEICTKWYKIVEAFGMIIVLLIFFFITIAVVVSLLVIGGGKCRNWNKEDEEQMRALKDANRKIHGGDTS